MHTSVHTPSTELSLRGERLRLSSNTCRRERISSLIVSALLAITLMAIVLIPRFADLDALVTPDEPIWIARSANFYVALADGDLKETYQFSHPGVTVMWLGAIGYRIVDPDLPDRINTHVDTADVRDMVIPAGERPVDRLVDLLKPMIVANALVMLALFSCLIPLVGRWTSFAAVSYLALDPLQIGFTRLLHLDGLSTNLLLVTLVSYTSYLQRRSWGFLVVSGIAAGLALLTRSVNGVLLPLMVVLTLFDIYRRAASEQIPIRGQVRFHFGRMVVWGLIVLATVFALWPALWVAPIDTIDQLVRGGSTLASAPHTRQLLFRGQVTGSDPGWSYYLVVLAYRLSPLTLLALVLSTFGLLAPRVGAAEPARRLCFNLAIFGAAYFVILSLAAKKLDRYLLPTLAALDLIAVIGTIAFVRYLVSQRAGISRYVATGIAVAAFLVLLGGQAVAARESAPYYITYVSPLMGGQSAARRSISLEWGEGGKAVAETILQHPEITSGTIAGGAWPRAIDYYLPFPLLSANHDLSPAGAAWFMQSQYVVVTEPEIQRQFYAPSMIAWFDSQSPVAVIQDDGRVYARIYDLSGLRVPDPYYQPDAPIFTWRGQATLVGSTYREQIEVGSDLRLRLFFETAGEPFYYRIDARVVDSAGNVVGEIRKRLRAEEPVPPEMRSIIDIDLPDDLAPGTYQIQIRMRDGETHETVQAVRAAIGQNARSPVTIGSFEITTDIPENDTPVDAET